MPMSAAFHTRRTDVDVPKSTVLTMGVAVRRCLQTKCTSAQRMSPPPRRHHWRSKLIPHRRAPSLCTPRRARALRRWGRGCSHAQHQTSHSDRRRNREKRTPNRRVVRTLRVRKCPCAMCLLLLRRVFLAGPFQRWGRWLRRIQHLPRSCVVIRNRTRSLASRRMRGWADHIRNVHTRLARETTRLRCSHRARPRTSCVPHRRPLSSRRRRIRARRNRSATRRTRRHPSTRPKALRSHPRSRHSSRPAWVRTRACRTHRRWARPVRWARHLQHPQHRPRAMRHLCRASWWKGSPRATEGEPRPKRCDEANA